ncbi:predicted protein [Coccidioides posadasii str. Silveira]|uniref:Predicted protein n=1 Tax=Coccidioides posadasii (strain RMSCC 757 / Silveira) TaxID=443226 RepID=E9DHS6_COCPS|nr:predicted protein [Coccidioides posadasii str. Silveira]
MGGRRGASFVTGRKQLQNYLNIQNWTETGFELTAGGNEGAPAICNMLGVILDSEESQQLPGQQAAPPNPVPQPRCVGGEWTGPGSGGSWERQPASRLRYLRPLNSKPRRRRNVLRVNKDPEVGGRGTELVVPACYVVDISTSGTPGQHLAGSA